MRVPYHGAGLLSPSLEAGEYKESTFDCHLLSLQDNKWLHILDSLKMGLTYVYIPGLWAWYRKKQKQKSLRIYSIFLGPKSAAWTEFSGLSLRSHLETVV